MDSPMVVPRPAGITLMMWAGLIFGPLAFLAVVTAPLDIFAYSIDYRPVSGATFLREGPVLWTLAQGALLLAMGIGIRRRARWARRAAVAAIAMLLAGSVVTIAPIALAFTGFIAFFSGLGILWYLYRSAAALFFEDAPAEHAPAEVRGLL